MTTIRSHTTVTSDGTVIVQVGESEAGATVDVTVSPVLPTVFPAAASQVNLPRDLWMKKFLQLEGSVPELIRPEQPMIDPIPEFD